MSARRRSARIVRFFARSNREAKSASDHGKLVLAEALVKRLAAARPMINILLEDGRPRSSNRQSVYYKIGVSLDYAKIIRGGGVRLSFPLLPTLHGI